MKLEIGFENGSKKETKRAKYYSGESIEADEDAGVFSEPDYTIWQHHVERDSDMHPLIAPTETGNDSLEKQFK